MFYPVQRLRHNCRALVLALKVLKHFKALRFNSIKNVLLKCFNGMLLLTFQQHALLLLKHWYNATIREYLAKYTELH